MRIISGIYKNRKINFKKLKSRPTTDFAKESLFNLLNNHYDLSSIYVLDLFSGSGNISYEFISRGCQHITAIDNNVKCIEFIKKIKAELQMKNLNIKLKNINYYIKKIESTYDIIFADPPYHYVQAHYMNIIENIFNRNLLKSSGMLIIEHSKFVNFEKHPFFLYQKKYGRVNFTFFKNEQ